MKTYIPTLHRKVSYTGKNTMYGVQACFYKNKVTKFNLLSQKISCEHSMAFVTSAGYSVFRYTSVTRATPLQLSICSIQTNGEPLTGFCKRPVIPLYVDYFVKSLHVHII